MRVPALPLATAWSSLLLSPTILLAPMRVSPPRLQAPDPPPAKENRTDIFEGETGKTMKARATTLFALTTRRRFSLAFVAFVRAHFWSHVSAQIARSHTSHLLLQTMLDALPVFACVNNRGQLCEFKFPALESALPVFYTDVGEARLALKQAQEDYPLLGVDIVPMGLGDAFRYDSGGVGLLVPGTADLMAAGAPPGADPMQEMRSGLRASMPNMPLFCCMEMAQEGPDGEPVLPLFMNAADAKEAMAQATAADDPSASLELQVLSLDRTLELLGGVNTGGKPPAFKFVPPAASMKQIAEYFKVGGQAVDEALKTADEQLEADLAADMQTIFNRSRATRDAEGDHDSDGLLGVKNK